MEELKLVYMEILGVYTLAHGLRYSNDSFKHDADVVRYSRTEESLHIMGYYRHGMSHSAKVTIEITLIPETNE